MLVYPKFDARTLSTVALLFSGIGMMSLGGCTHPAHRNLGSNTKTTSPLSQANGQNRVLLISIDGLRPEFYLNSKEYEAPHLHALAAQGVYTEGMEGIFPTLTYPTHTTLVTGVPSGQHGVLGNTVFSAELGPTNEWNWFASHIKVPTLWDRVTQAGGTVGIIRWPVSVGAQVNWFIPEIFYAPGFSFEKDWELIRQNTKPDLLSEVMEGSHLTTEKGFHSLSELDQFTSHAATKILRDHEPDLTLIHLVNLDIAQHSTGRSSPKTHAALKEVDTVLGSILKTVDLSHTTVMVLGDHGFMDYRRLIHLNSWFREKKWLEVKDGKLVNWQVAAHAEGGQAAIYVRNPKLRSIVLKTLRENAKGRYTVIPAADLKKLSAYPDALCALEATQDIAFGINLEGPIETDVGQIKGAHGHLPTRPELKAGLIIAGVGVTKRGSIGQVRAFQITPTIAHLFGLPPIPTDQKPISLRAPAGEKHAPTASHR